MAWDNYTFFDWLTGQPIADNIVAPTLNTLSKGLGDKLLPFMTISGTTDWLAEKNADKIKENYDRLNPLSKAIFDFEMKHYQDRTGNQIIDYSTPEPTPATTPAATTTPTPTATEEEKTATQTDDVRAQALEDQARAWEREDKIRQEIEKREDTAYQRAVEDMRKAGINPELIGNLAPAGSGGGIASATMPNYSLQTTEINTAIQQAINAVKNDTTISEGEKNRTTDLLRTLLTVALIAFKK